MTMFKPDKISLGPDTPLLRAIEAIDAGSVQIALIVDDNKRLLGTLTDGDVRRSILRGVSIDSPVSAAMNGSPHTLPVGTPRDVILRQMSSFCVRQMPIVDAVGCVVGLELIDNLLPTEVSDHWVVLMAGGLGARLRPLTNDVPKPMLPVGGRPLLETIIRNFETQNYRNIFLSVNYKSDVIRKYFGNGERFGVNIEYLVEDRPMGTAGALSLLPRRPTAPLIVMNGDLLTSVNFRHVLEFHNQHNAAATMCVREYSFQVPYGVVQTDGVQLSDIIEKPVHNVFVNAGVYVIDPAALQQIPPAEFFDMPQLFQQIRSSGARAAVFPIHEYWIDIGRFDDLERAHSEFAKVFGAQ